MGQKIRTATGIEYPVNWCGIASIDGILRFYVPNGNLVELTTVFADAENLPVTHVFDDEVVQDYTDYTVCFGVTMDYLGGATVELARA